VAIPLDSVVVVITGAEYNVTVELEDLLVSAMLMAFMITVWVALTVAGAL
jgi:hypothetical protein